MVVVPAIPYHISLLVLIILVNMLVALINDTYQHVRTAKMYEYDADLLNYAWKRLKGIVDVIGIFNHKGISFFNHNLWTCFCDESPPCFRCVDCSSLSIMQLIVREEDVVDLGILLSLLDSMGNSGVVFCLAQYSTTPRRTIVSSCSIPVCPLGCEVHTVLSGATSGVQCIMDNGHMAYRNVIPGFSKGGGGILP